MAVDLVYDAAIEMVGMMDVFSVVSMAQEMVEKLVSSVVASMAFCLAV